MPITGRKFGLSSSEFFPTWAGFHGDKFTWNRKIKNLKGDFPRSFLYDGYGWAAILQGQLLWEGRIGTEMAQVPVR
jgi:hypothetical protein